MSVFLYVVCEGQSENAFIREILIPYIGERTDWKVNLWPTTIMTSFDKRAGRVYRGGLSGYEKARSEISKWMSTGNYVTSMFDFYALPEDFPGIKDAGVYQSDYDKVKKIESAFLNDIIENNEKFSSSHFIPYIQLHEFEALMFTDLSALKKQYLSDEDHSAIDSLINETSDILPENIDSGIETAPSKRLKKTINYKKGSSVVYPLKEIGIDRIRKKCPHFDEWICAIEDLAIDSHRKDD